MKNPQAFEYSGRIHQQKKTKRKINDVLFIFRQLCDLGFLSLLPGETSDNTSDTISLFQSDMIDNGLANFSSFLSYIRKHTDRLNVRAGRKTQQKAND